MLTNNYIRYHTRCQVLSPKNVRFYRGINVLNEEGIGIGLYLSREIITKQNGYIKVSSSQKGSIFSIFLPNE